MRVTTGLGLVVIMSLLACSAGGAGTASSSSGGAGSGSGSATDPAASNDPTNPEKAPSPIVANLDVTGVAVFQAVKVDVVKSGAAVGANKRNAPIVAKRPGMMRIYVKPGSGWKSREVTAEVRLVSGDTKFPILSETKTVRAAASTDEDIDSTFNIELPAENLPAGVTFQVALTAEDGTQVAEGEESTGRFPLDGSFGDLGAEVSGKLKVVLVPIKYDTDGSGRTPDVSAKQIELYKKTLMRWYPTSEVELTTHQPYAWTTTISRNGTGFSNVLRAMHQLRQRDSVDDDVYYYGVFSPTSSMQTFCQGGCVAGLSTVADEDTPVMRASVGLGFAGQQSANTMAHELGHAHGREHAPCGGAQGVDSDFPYSQGQIGVWGYDIFDKTLISPTKGRDMMGYCPNEWVSDYTFKHLFERISSISTEKYIQFSGTNASSNASKTAYRIATVGADGALSWDDSGAVDAKTELKGGSAVATHFLAESGAELLTRDARFFRFDHLPGGLLFVPQDSTAAWTKVRVDGFQQQLVR
jgi:hypothetical protein